MIFRHMNLNREFQILFNFTFISNENEKEKNVKRKV